VRGSGPGADSVESSGTRVSDRHAAAGWRDTARSETDTFAKDMYYREDDFAVADAVAAVQSNGARRLHRCMRVVLQAPGITAPIIGTTKTQQLTELIAAVDIS